MTALQLKIVISDSRPPIWRKVLVNAEATFWDLHSIIQDLFGWEDEHLHSFRPFYKGAKEKHVYFEIPSKNDRVGFITPGAIRGAYYDERKEKLINWFDKKRNTYRYTYDFGDNWQHEIMLEKIVNEDSVKLAQYLGGKRRAPQEDSRPDFMLDCTSFINAAEKSGALWQEVLEAYGKTRAEQLLKRAQKEATSLAPSKIRFSDPKTRYKVAKSRGSV